MTGNEAAAIVEQLCLEKGHAHSVAPGNAPRVCGHCSTVMNRLRAKHKEDQPTPPPVLVHFVIDPQSGLQATMLDEAKSSAKAQAIQGLVVSMPVSADWRAQT